MKRRASDRGAKAAGPASSCRPGATAHASEAAGVDSGCRRGGIETERPRIVGGGKSRGGANDVAGARAFVVDLGGREIQLAARAYPTLVLTLPARGQHIALDIFRRFERCPAGGCWLVYMDLLAGGRECGTATC